MNPKEDKLFNLPTILLVPIGIALNILLAQLVIVFKLPLFLDSVGTIIVSALGGLLPGIMVGFFGNVINSIGDPITLYYGVISIMLAILSVFFSKYRMFTRFGGTLATIVPYALVGGALGSLLTWTISGLTIGSGVSSSYAIVLIDNFGFSPFIAQLIADFVIDLADKAITVLLVFVVIKCLPNKLLSRFPYSDIYVPAEVSSETRQH